MHKLACLTNSYHSQHLLKTLVEMAIPVHTGPGLSIDKRYGMRSISDEKTASYLACGDLKLYINAEDSLAFIEQRSDCDVLKRRISFFKDKYEFRRSLKSIYPDFFIEKASVDNLRSLPVPEDRELILKPALGFHSLGIRRFKGRRQLLSAMEEALSEIRGFGHVFNSSVLSGEVFIVEDYIEGEELACDAFFDNSGRPVINAIYKHAFANSNDTRDLLYYTSSEIMETYLPAMSNLLELIAERTGVRNFPVHIEVRQSADKLIPIEVNPLRFGGFGLADLALHAFGVNSYRNYFSDERPDWDAIIHRSDKAFYAFVVGQRPDVFDPQKNDIDHEKYKATFRELMEYVPIDASRYRFFSTAFARSVNLPDLLNYLHMDFSQFRTDI